MKPIPAIVETAPDLAAEQVIVWRDEERHAETSAARFEQQASAARATAAARRLQIGELLVKQRERWPLSGPRARGWGEWLAKAKLDDSTAWRYMDAWKNRGSAESDGDGDVGDPSQPSNVRGNAPDDRPEPVLGQSREPAPFRQLTEAELAQAIGRLDPEARKRLLTAARTNVKGGSGEPDRGKWCTSKPWAQAVGPWDHDPFSNPRSYIASVTRCMLEDGGDAFGGGEPGATLGLYRTGNAHGLTPASGIADASTKVWIQPPYELVAEAIAHYGHTRFCALLRWSPDVKAWFPHLWERTAVVCHPFGERMDFEPPPGVDKSGDMPFPHALYYADERDVTDEVRAKCIVWRVDHSLDCAQLSTAALHIVR